MAGITAKDIDLAEVHDCFTIAELLATEDLGLATVAKLGCLQEKEEVVEMKEMSVSTQVVD